MQMKKAIRCCAIDQQKAGGDGREVELTLHIRWDPAINANTFLCFLLCVATKNKE
jgi:hypothetical protein